MSKQNNYEQLVLPFNNLLTREDEQIIEQGLGIGFTNYQCDALAKIAKRKDLVAETNIAFEEFEHTYKERVNIHNKMLKDPILFYHKNKKLRKTDKHLLTYKSLSLSYSFCSPINTILTILKDAQLIKDVKAYDNEYGAESDSMSFLVVEDIRREEYVKLKYKCLIKDLRGNKVPEDLFTQIADKVSFNYRDTLKDNYGFDMLTKENLIDAMYIFFGSKEGAEFINNWHNSDNKEQILDSFEYTIHNNPFVNPGLVDSSLQDFMSEKHIEKANHFLEKNKGLDRRYDLADELVSMSKRVLEDNMKK